MALVLVDVVPHEGRLFDPDDLGWRPEPAMSPDLTVAQRRAVVERACARAGVDFGTWWLVPQGEQPATRNRSAA